MRSNDVVLAYYSMPEAAAPIAPGEASSLGAVFVGTRVTFVRKPASGLARPANDVPLPPTPPGIEIQSYSSLDADSGLIELARQAGQYSRFRIDARIQVSVFYKIYDAWLMRSIRREIADEVYVATLGSRAVGLLTLSAAAPHGTIGLLSVDSSARGRGLGRRLAELAVEWSNARGRTEIQVATQLENEAACGLYVAAGFLLETREPTYHLWLR
jgi:dTDP-4-amino-4,6-dideoxy-D-galactose acyltransferase